ncbi:MAG: serine/threonine protein kinase [Planctomycetes bacterium]|nr:serine/threonine protein kinase [Planctomycetota bacterium]
MARLGAYEVEAELGRGGVARVLRGRHVETGAVHALKVLEHVTTAEEAARFRREAEALARLDGAGVVAVHALWVEDRRMVLAMDLMPGGTLRARLARPWPWREAAALVVGLARTLQGAHALGLVHRDVKPENVLFDDEGRPRLADFGCARDLAAESLTATGAAPGTVAYMAPEQLEGRRVDGRADVWALGVLLHELVAGRRPFEAGSPLALLSAITSGTRPRRSPRPLAEALSRALVVDPAARADAGALADALEAALAGRSDAPRGAWLVAAALGGLALAAVALARGGAPPPPAPDAVAPPAAPEVGSTTPDVGAPAAPDDAPEVGPPEGDAPATSPAAVDLDALLAAIPGPVLPSERDLSAVYQPNLRYVDPEKAARVCRVAIEGGGGALEVSMAWHVLGCLIDDGAAFDRDPAAALACFGRAAALGHAGAKIKLAEAHLDARPPRPAPAADLLRAALERAQVYRNDAEHARRALVEVGLEHPDVVGRPELMDHLGALKDKGWQLLLKGRLAELEGDLEEARGAYFTALTTSPAVQAAAHVRLERLPGGGPRSLPDDPALRLLIAERLVAEGDPEERARAVDLLRERAGKGAGVPRRAALLLAERFHLEELEAGRGATTIPREEALRLLRAAARGKSEVRADQVLRARRLLRRLEGS